jgi:hypothetical protein
LSRYTRCLKVASSTITSTLATIGTLRYEKAERNLENQSQGFDTRVSLSQSAPLLNNTGVGKMSRCRPPSVLPFWHLSFRPSSTDTHYEWNPSSTGLWGEPRNWCLYPEPDQQPCFEKLAGKSTAGR